MTGWNDADVKALGRLAADQVGIARAIERQVTFLREQGCPWSVIGECLGTTRQAAQMRYGKSPEQV